MARLKIELSIWWSCKIKVDIKGMCLLFW